MKVLYLFNSVIHGTEKLEKIAKGVSNDNSFLGMLRLRKHGFETSYIEIEQYVPLWFANFLRKHIFNIWWIHLPLFPFLLRHDVIISSTAYGSLLVKSLLHIKRPKWIMVDFNISGSIGNAETIKQKVFRWTVSKCDGIVAISEAEEKKLKEIFPHLKDNIIFLREGVDSNYFKPMKATEHTDDYILSVGLDPSRDFKTLIEATKNLDIKVKLATKPSMIKEFEPLSKKYFCKKYDIGEMPALFANAKIVVNGLNIKPNSNDSMGTFSVAEAMSMGKAVIVTRTNSFASYIEDGVTGVFVNPHDVENMRSEIQKLLKDEEKRKKIEINARNFIVNYVDAELFAENLAKYIKKIYNN
ncbi:TPA: hypothetical protein DEP58_02970 [Patescibacteria group bacterium]|nr:MAG: Glycosyl transferase, group 1 [Parcubacteria group bacterium GW2011_GWD2_42_14]HCC05244.1 hypothetical protein [Patescibacteria group bacterium]